MSALVIEGLDGQRLARVTRASDGTLNVSHEVSEHQHVVADLLAEVTARALTVREYREEDTAEGKVRRLEIVRECSPDDPQYLAALADAITRQRRKIGGRTVRGYVEAT